MTTPQKKVPALRFPEFEGEWKEVPIKKVANIYDGTHQTPKYMKEGVRFVSVENISNLNETTKFISKEAFESDFKIKPQKDDILMTRITAGVIGATAIVENNEPLGYYVSLALIRKKNDVNTLFLNQRIDSDQFKRELHKRIIHVAFPKKINLGDIGHCKISHPSLPEQQKIAAFLTAIDNRIGHLERKKTLLEQYKKGVMHQIFSQELRFKDDNRKDFPAWEEKRIDKIFKVTRGNVLATSLTKEKSDSEYCYPVYSSQTKNFGLMGYYNEYLYENALTWTTDGANAGDVNLREGKFYCTNVCGVLLSDKGYANRCVAEILNSVSRRYVSYVGNPKLMNNVMSSIKIKLPSSIEEQQKIAAFLTAIDYKINLVADQVEKTKTYKKGLLQQMFV